MPESVTPVELRRSPRARLHLPARIRWLGPLGMRLEVAETIDVSREGLLIRRDERCNLLARVWVAYPFDPSAASIQPETPARIARVQGGAQGGFYVALELQLPPRESPRDASEERRRSARFSFALPIFVRPAGSLWPEESMTQNISNHGVRFESARTYKIGEKVLAKIPWGEWAKPGEMTGHVIRVECPEETSSPTPTLGSVAVEWANIER
ncbi:MAG TPA: PilZ domain-containing protein [Candidatus Baltobacteraceae bacterium]|nr:PilZ domain-containing protein [Candidatus Baltobacteraceae bacterium]